MLCNANDLDCSANEFSSGSMRTRDVQAKIFQSPGYSEEEAYRRLKARTQTCLAHREVIRPVHADPADIRPEIQNF